ncbi:MAG TPA: hypothetical protein PLA50_16180 [Bacteroidia bacterium]|nr:hypothetical protein [Bacteroidia bacterium]
MRFPFLLLALAVVLVVSGPALSSDDGLRVGVFSVDATPPVGSPLAYDTMEGVNSPLSCRGLVLAGAGKPVVLCAIDWIGIGSAGQTVFKEAIAVAVGTEPDRVSVHTLHQHDAPRCDFSGEELIAAAGISGGGFNPEHARSVAAAAVSAATEGLAKARSVTHLGTGQAVVDRVASNRRPLGPDGKVIAVRPTATRDPKIRDLPIGTVDPVLRLVSFHNGDEVLAVLTWFATHPQSYYRTKQATVDFPGMARAARETETGIPHLHFNGAGGNVGAGKWNDGAPENRQVLADRVTAAMREAWEKVEKRPLSAGEVDWQVERVALPVAAHLDEAKLEEFIANRVEPPMDRFRAATRLTWLRRCREGDTIPVGCLRLGDVRVLHLPGELFVEYQLAAQALRPDLFVAMAAYGDYAPGYIGTDIAYGQGGYETSDRASNVAPGVEKVLMGAIAKLLDTELPQQ